MADTKTYLEDAKPIVGSIPLGEYRADDPRTTKLTIEQARKVEQFLMSSMAPVIGPPQMQAAFVSGLQAKQKGFMRVTPYYECAPLDHFWLAGYDGKSLTEAANGLV